MATKTRTKGIYQKVAKDGTVTYLVMYYEPDPLAKNGWKPKGKRFDKYQDAVDFKVKHQAQVKTGEYAPQSDLTLKEIAEKWLEARKPGWKTQTYLGHKAQINKHIAPKLGHVKATSLKGVEVETAGAEWEREISHKTVNKLFATLNAVYKFAKKLGIKQNPMADVERLRRQIAPEELEARALGEIADYGQDAPDEKPGSLRAIGADEVYSAQELRKIIEAAEPGFEKAFLMTAILTGLRHGELMALRWPVVDLKKGSVVVNRSLTQLKGGPVLERPKTKNAYRRLKLAPELAKVLTAWKLQHTPNANGLLFVNELGKPTSRKQNNRMLKAICERSEVKALNVNNLRHSFASQNLIAGVPPLKVSAMMGHSDPAVTLKVYSRWAEGEESNAEAMLAGRIFKAEAESAEAAEG